MPKKCQCGFFHPDNDLNNCPDCGEALKFTMFAPPGFRTECDQSRGAEAWHQQAAPYEQLELPIGVRLSQIGAGIGIYWLISRTIMGFFFAACLVGNTDVQLERALIVFPVLALAFYVVGALAGGAVAGAWSVNWVPQGVGVGAGVFVVPLITYCLFAPVDGVGLAAFFVVVCITTAISVFGAYVGHKLIRPSRFIVS